MEKLDTLDLYNDDCFNVFSTLEEKSINLFVLDLPYNQTACKWDQDIIPLDKMWEAIKRIMKPNGIIVHFCTAKFGYRLIHSNYKWFRYDLIWKKSRKVGFLSANKMPLRQHENIYLFKPEQGTYHPQKTPRDVDYKHSGKRSSEQHYGNMIECKKEYKKEDGKHPTSIIDHENLYIFSNANNDDLRQYAQKVLDYIGKSLKQINKDMGNRHAEHFFYIKSTQFGIPTEETYNKLIEIYKIDQMEGFITYDNIEITYNPQKTKGKPYKSKERIEGKGVYIKENYKRTATKDTTNRHPTSIIDHENLYVFSHANNDDLDISRNKDLRAYAQKVKDYIGKSKTEIIKDIGQTIDHFLRIKSSQFGIPTEETYNKLIELYELNKMNNFIPYETLKGMWEKNEDHTTYNPQKTKGKPYKTNGRKDGLTVYGSVTGDPIENKGDRHPASLIDYEGDSILIYKNPHKTIHRTQKPVELCEWLIKTYSNEGETVMDFTMGSGTTAIACLNTNRKFVGVEKDKEIFNLAQDRIVNHLSL